MVYTCQRCGYNTNVFFNFERHKNRVRPCKLIETNRYTDTGNNLQKRESIQKEYIDYQNIEDPHQNIETDYQNIEGPHQNIEYDYQNVEDLHQNIETDYQNVEGTQKIEDVNQKIEADHQNTNGEHTNTYKCSKCTKTLSSNHSLKRHMLTCKGVLATQCPKCLKSFTSTYGKYIHLKNVTCTPINPHYPMTVNNNTNNTTNNNTTNHITNNNTNNTINNNQKKIIHQHIQINAFGNENCDYLLDENQRLKKMLVQKDAFMQNIIEAVHFDEEHPENHNIMMTNLQSKHVLIHDGTKFVKALKEPTFNKLIQSKRKIINGNIEELGLTIGSERYIKEKMAKLRVDDECQKILKDKVELMCYNKKQMCDN